MGFTREDLITTNLRLAAANRGSIYVAGRTPITVLHMGGRDLWKYVKRPINRIITDKNKVPMFF